MWCAASSLRRFPSEIVVALLHTARGKGVPRSKILSLSAQLSLCGLARRHTSRAFSRRQPLKDWQGQQYSHRETRSHPLTSDGALMLGIREGGEAENLVSHAMLLPPSPRL